jgi:transposase InsO family protein
VELLLTTRHAHPTWGPRKILAYLAHRHRRAHWPAASTVGTLFKTHGLVRSRPRRRPLGHPGRPTTPMTASNDVWTADFKGHFATGDGRRCHPLTVVDGYSRYLLACQALTTPSHVAAPPVFERLFRGSSRSRSRTSSGFLHRSVASRLRRVDYNEIRPHGSLGHLTPREYAEQCQGNQDGEAA